MGPNEALVELRVSWARLRRAKLDHFSHGVEIPAIEYQRDVVVEKKLLWAFFQEVHAHGLDPVKVLHDLNVGVRPWER